MLTCFFVNVCCDKKVGDTRHELQPRFKEPLQLLGSSDERHGSAFPQAGDKTLRPVSTVDGQAVRFCLPSPRRNQDTVKAAISHLIFTAPPNTYSSLCNTGLSVSITYHHLRPYIVFRPKAYLHL